MIYKAGDVVKVWSLQSFSGGGFLEGSEAIVKQDQIGTSVIVAVRRNMQGTMKLDPSYEVYAKQVELVHSPSAPPDQIESIIAWLKAL